jgi:hypothetical protein
LILSSQSSAERGLLENGVRSVYAAAYGATIRRFLPLLLGLADPHGTLLGVIGAQPGGDPAPMFLEAYLDRPVEEAVARVVRAPLRRKALAEVGNLASVQPGAGLALVSTLAAYLDGAGFAWAVFTATDSLRAAFVRRRLELADLGPADGRRLGSGLAEWGRYYETAPRVTAAQIGAIRSTLASDERLAASCEALWDEAFGLGRRDARDAA